ncbi:hypothetical protein BMS3Bbin02_02186 [bacterium BMS3Bbin02]|nr:hypothetical protein BMS3Bbin02_02186 [bacterium BMS3Bbin02]HDH25286.1 hypothetical protein [Actinomycetota bacterium]
MRQRLRAARNVGFVLRLVGYVLTGFLLVPAGWALLAETDYEPRSWVLFAGIGGFLLIVVDERFVSRPPRRSAIQRGIAIGAVFAVLGWITIVRARYDGDSELAASGGGWLVVGIAWMVGPSVHELWSKRKNLT